MTEVTEVTATKKIIKQGSSLVVPVTKEAELLNVGAGTIVEIRIKKANL